MAATETNLYPYTSSHMHGKMAGARSTCTSQVVWIRLHILIRDMDIGLPSRTASAILNNTCRVTLLRSPMQGRIQTRGCRSVITSLISGDYRGLPPSRLRVRGLGVVTLSLLGQSSCQAACNRRTSYHNTITTAEFTRVIAYPPHIQYVVRYSSRVTRC